VAAPEPLRPGDTPVARPTKLTKATQERICAALREGNYFSTACEAAGVGESTAREWVARGEGRSERPAGPPFAAFAAAVKKARAEAEAHALRQVRDAAAEGTWQAAAWYLERAHPERWARGRADLVQLEVVQVLVDEAIEAALALMNEQAQAQYLGRLRAHGSEQNGHGLRVVVER
jgi:hypothetical protein